MNKHNTRKGQSLFGPIILIGIGVFFLLRNMGMVPQANLAILFQLWPLWLIFLGVNIVVRQAPKRLGSALSGLVALSAVFTASYFVFFSEDNALLTRLGIRPAQMEVVTETVTFEPTNVSRADISLQFGSRGGTIYALEQSEALLRGDVSHSDDLRFDARVDGNTAIVSLGRGAIAPWHWFSSGGGEPWRIGLNPVTPLDLNIDAGAGSVTFDLAALTIENLWIDVGSGSSTLTLPGGNYAFNLDVGSGSSRLVFAESGRIQADIDGGSGSLSVTLPAGLPARIEVQAGSGSISLPRTFELVDGQRGGDGIWETADFTADRDGLNLYIDVGSGGVSVRQEAGGR